MPAKKSTTVLSDVELEAMKDTVRERKAAARRGSRDERAEGERDTQAKIAEMPADERAMAERIHELVATNAPNLVPRTFYGMPAYALNGKVICFFQAKSKFKVRYSTVGFQPEAHIDEGDMWPVAFAVVRLTPSVEARLVALIRQAAS